jgi:CBS domain-containing protein
VRRVQNPDALPDDLWNRVTMLKGSFRIGRIAGGGLGVILVAGSVLWVVGVAGGMWITLTGFLLTAAAGAEHTRAHAGSALIGLRVGDIMSREPVAMPIDLSARDAARYFSEFHHVSFPVTDPVGWPVGLLSVDAVQHLADERRDAAKVAELADTDPGLVAAAEDDIISLLARPAFRRVGRAAVVGSDGRLAGIVSVTDLQRTIRAPRVSGTAVPSPVPPPPR